MVSKSLILFALVLVPALAWAAVACKTSLPAPGQHGKLPTYRELRAGDRY